MLAGGRRAGRLDDEAAPTRSPRGSGCGPGCTCSSCGSVVTTSAAALVGRHPLRAADALHLASALELRSPDLVVAAWDEHLAAAARAEGLLVVP